MSCSDGILSLCWLMISSVTYYQTSMHTCVEKSPHPMSQLVDRSGQAWGELIGCSELSPMTHHKDFQENRKWAWQGEVNQSSS